MTAIGLRSKTIGLVTGRRESNPRGDSSKALKGQSLQSGRASGVAPEQHLAATEGLCLASNGTPTCSLPAPVARVAEAWPELPPHIRGAILTLVDASTAGSNRREWMTSSIQKPQLDDLALQLARKCRVVIQSCLREEEWGDADREFFAVISAGLVT